MKTRILLIVILVTSIFGGARHFNLIPSFAVTGSDTPVPATTVPRGPTASNPTTVAQDMQLPTIPASQTYPTDQATPTNQAAPTTVVFDPLPERVFSADGKHAIAKHDFTIYKNSTEASEEAVGTIRYGMLVEVLEMRKDCFTVPVKPKKEIKQNENPQDENRQDENLQNEEYVEEDYEYVDPYEGKTLDCYKVKKDAEEGWAADRHILEFNVPIPSDHPQDLLWFFQKYGESTWYYEEALNENSFTNEEYERLIAAAQGGYAYDVPHIALRLTLMKKLKQNPDDPKLAEFKEKVKHLEGLTY